MAIKNNNLSIYLFDRVCIAAHCAHHIYSAVKAFMALLLGEGA